MNRLKRINICGAVYDNKSERFGSLQMNENVASTEESWQVQQI
jgi:hypothetical protein